MRNELYRDGKVIRAEVVDLAANTLYVEVDGVIVEGPRPLTAEERRTFGPPPLEGTALVATLNAVLGVWSLQDAANIAQLPEQALIDEAQAWAAAQQPSA